MRNLLIVLFSLLSLVGYSQSSIADKIKAQKKAEKPKTELTKPASEVEKTNDVKVYILYNFEVKADSVEVDAKWIYAIRREFYYEGVGADGVTYRRASKKPVLYVIKPTGKNEEPLDPNNFMVDPLPVRLPTTKN